MKRIFFPLACAFTLLAASAPARLSAQFLGRFGDAAPSADGVSIGVLFGQMAPQTKFRDGSTFNSSKAVGVGVTFWAARYLGFEVSMVRTSHVGSAAADGRSSVVSGRDPTIDTYMVDMIGRVPLVQEGAVSVAPYVSLGGGWKSYAFRWDTKGGPDARGLDLTWAPGAGVELRMGSEHRVGLRGEFHQLRTKMGQPWADQVTFQDRMFTGGLFMNF